jgi:peroxiredoxin
MTTQPRSWRPTWSDSRTATPCPSLGLPAVGGGKLSLPDDVGGRWATVLIYRGSWCPYCAAQLRAFSQTAPQLAKEEVAVVALSVDDEATSAATIATHRISFPVGHSADAMAVSALLGSYLGGRGGSRFFSQPASCCGRTERWTWPSTAAGRSAG